jgi:hypothetical protein
MIGEECVKMEEKCFNKYQCIQSYKTLSENTDVGFVSLLFFPTWQKNETIIFFN